VESISIVTHARTEDVNLTGHSSRSIPG